MSRRVWLVLAVVVVLAVVAGVPAAVVYQRKRTEREQRAAAADFARAWTGGTLAKLAYSGITATKVATGTASATKHLTARTKDAPDSVAVTSIVRGSSKNVATARLAITWTLSGDRTWRYTSQLGLAEVGGAWLPQWAPSVVHPQLTGDQTLVATTKPATRGEIVGADDKVLVTTRPIVVVGLEPSRTTDLAGSASKIAKLVDVDGAALAKRAKAASPNAFVEVIRLRQDAYAAVKSKLQPIPGAVFQTTEQPLAPTPLFARALIGTVGAATADIVTSSKGRVSAGDVTGISCLQRSYDEQLSGKPGLVVQIVNPVTSASVTGTTPAGTTTTNTSTSQKAPVTLFTANPVNGTAVHVTLDEKVQDAADAAIAKAPKAAGMIVLQASTGKVLAVANGGPNGAYGYDRALLGQYPPGSTFKVASSLALLGAGVTTNTTVNCPASITVGGKKFDNAENEKTGATPFHRDFANSCNTAFVGSSTRITGKELAAAASSLGYGQPTTSLGVTAFAGQVPTDGDAVAHAAAMIGQGTVLASPLTVAGTAAAVASGSWHSPTLVTGGTGSTKATSNALPAQQVKALRLMMREVVTGGTAKGVFTGVPGGPVYGKTGTAEFGNKNPPQTHAWFTGYQGDIAFAVVVEDGGFGAKTAAPIAADLLKRLAG